LLNMGYTYRVQVSGSQTEVGIGESKIESFTLFDPNGNDVTDEFIIRCIPGVLEVLAPDTQIVSVYLYQLQKTYDGKPLAFGADDFEFIELPDGVTVELTLNISLTDVGYLTLSKLNQDFEQYAQYRVYEKGTMKDVTKRYRIIFSQGELADFYVPIRVQKRNITVTAESATKQYDGEALTNENAFISVGTLLEGHRLEYVTAGSLTAPGTRRNKVVQAVVYDAEGYNITSNYFINKESGLLTVIDPE
ncbi:MAG: hypothetical protein IKD07_02980, partial [Clostridia bacterium]|nr:hypothetical protein [Clostridia bacterium]